MTSAFSAFEFGYLQEGASIDKCKTGLFVPRHRLLELHTDGRYNAFLKM